MSTMFEQLATVVLEGSSDKSPGMVQQALDSGLAPKEILEKGLIVGMTEVGVRFKRGDMFVPEVLMSAETMQTALNVLRPHLIASDVNAGQGVAGHGKRRSARYWQKPGRHDV